MKFGSNFSTLLSAHGWVFCSIIRRTIKQLLYIALRLPQLKTAGGGGTFVFKSSLPPITFDALVTGMLDGSPSPAALLLTLHPSLPNLAHTLPVAVGDCLLSPT